MRKGRREGPMTLSSKDVRLVRLAKELVRKGQFGEKTSTCILNGLLLVNFRRQAPDRRESAHCTIRT